MRGVPLTEPEKLWNHNGEKNDNKEFSTILIAYTLPRMIGWLCIRLTQQESKAFNQGVIKALLDLSKKNILKRFVIIQGGPQNLATKNQESRTK